MSTISTVSNGWKSLPLPLKVVPIVMVLWAVGSVANLPNLMNNGVPFFGATLLGIGAFFIALFFDVIAPLVFLIGLWYRRSWAPKWAALYISIFVLNGFITLFTSAEQFGAVQILVPCLISLAMLSMILWKRSYFLETS